jgi:hypothetical protein
MATSPAFCDVFERYCEIPNSTSMLAAQRLRVDESVLRRGRRGAGALDLSAAEVANWVIALCAATATTRKSPDAIETVKRARAAVRLHDPELDRDCPAPAIEGLAIAGAKTFGEAIDGLLADMRNGAFSTWTGSKPHILRISFFNNGGRITINLWRYREGGAQQAVLVFRNDGHPADKGSGLTFIHELNGDVLVALAGVLGPVPSEVRMAS